MEPQLIQVLLLGAAFHLLFLSFQTSVFIQQTVVNSIRQRPEYHFTGDGYVSLCITYAVFACSNWLAPSVIAVTGVKYGMFFGSLTYVAYSASFIQPTTILFYSAAALIGLGAGILWTAQGSFLSQMSNSETSSRNAAIFWSLLQSSILFGNLFVYFAFDHIEDTKNTSTNSKQKQETISDKTRYLIYGVLTLVGALGSVVLLMLRGKIKSPRQQTTIEEQEQGDDKIELITAWSQFVAALKLAKTLDMILLSTAFLFTGQLLSFFTGVYGTAIGATTQFGPQAKSYIGLAGIFIGLGEISGGLLFGLLGNRVACLQNLRRDTIFLIGYLVTLAALTLTFINLPANSTFGSGSQQQLEAQLLPIIGQPRVWISMLASMAIGLGDACFNTQIYSLLMSVYAHNSVGAFALFKFVQSTGSAIAFLYSTRLNLYYQLLILALISTLATICFCWIERIGGASNTNLVINTNTTRTSPLRRGKIEKTESQQNIITSTDDCHDCHVVSVISNVSNCSNE